MVVAGLPRINFFLTSDYKIVYIIYTLLKFIIFIKNHLNYKIMKTITYQTSSINIQPMPEMLENKGIYGQYGGAYIPPVLKYPLEKLSDCFEQHCKEKSFIKEFVYYLKNYTGRPSPLYYAARLSEHLQSKIYLKREDLNHTGSHKINNTIGQVLLAKRMKAKEIIAETGAGQHGVATATAAALMGIPCKIFMGTIDCQRQSLNVKRMQMLGAQVIPTQNGTVTLKDAVDAALEYFISHPDSFYLLGSQVGPHPYPKMVGYFQSVIGNEAQQQILAAENRLLDAAIACIGGGSNAIGLFSGFLAFPEVQLFGAEGGGECIINNTAATLNFGKPLVFQGTYSYCLADEEGNPCASHSVAAGLDYPGISPQHAYLKDSGRASYYAISDDEALKAFRLLSELEGIIPAVESAHAVALADKLFKNKNKLCVINLSGRGDKDVERNF